MNGVILAIDQGTTSSTALVFTEDRSIIGTSSNEIRQTYPKPGWVEQDPDEIWNVSLSVMRQAILNANCSHAQVKAIGISNQRETILVWDRATGIPIHPAIVWQSRQSLAIWERLRSDGFEVLKRAKTGLVIDPYFSASKIPLLFDRYPDLHLLAKNGKVVLGTIDSCYSGTSAEVVSMPLTRQTLAEPCCTTSMTSSGTKACFNFSTYQRLCSRLLSSAGEHSERPVALRDSLMGFLLQE